MKRKVWHVVGGTALVLLLTSPSVYATTSINQLVPTASDGGGTHVVNQLNQPWGLTMSQDGLIIVDSANQKIRKLKNGKLMTVAGAERPLDAYGQPRGGYVDGDAIKAVFNHPSFAVADTKGNLYISDTDNHVIRKITGGKVYTLAGTGKPGYKDGKGAEAQFYTPTGLAIDRDDNLYVADTLNNVIRKIAPDGAVTTFAGQQTEIGGYTDGSAGEARFNEPVGLAFDGTGGVYVSDSGNQLIRFISDGKVTTFAGKATIIDKDTGYMDGGYRNGDRYEARFNHPQGLIYVDGVLFIADSLNHRVRAVQSDGKVRNIAGQSTPGDTIGSAENKRFNQPVALAYTEGQLYVSDSLNNKVKTVPVHPKRLEPVRSTEDLLAGTELLPVSEEIQVWFDGKHVDFQAGVRPYKAGDKMYLPIRPLFEQWGAKVEWLPATKEVQLKKENWSATIIRSDNVQVVVEAGVTYVESGYLKNTLPQFLFAYDEEYNALVIDSGQ
ncbi:SMP-30/gluconolactonase/LRE family protein [Aneurinibacillus migulanus]|uniref:SMP-30/gluconolactonase/LRE family protein n=1 Tax=Aneurinibacillus migulanus TaxID=47500 RepID=UPI0020A1D3E8|nr:SMP-30/gluconolactonase/LRE family protein [Aneurinibacillus migulanus]MCP1358498.1 SMP-30/gluconolactonase/LRE family protein [Aneurinibacillus migulanus]